MTSFYFISVSALGFPFHVLRDKDREADLRSVQFAFLLNID